MIAMPRGRIITIPSFDLEKLHRSDSAPFVRPAESQLTKSVAGRLGVEAGSTIQLPLSLRNLTGGVQPCRFFLTSEQHADGGGVPTHESGTNQPCCIMMTPMSGKSLR
jgi:hypothetical protein